MSNKKVLHIIDTLWIGGAQTLIKKIAENEENAYVFVLRKTEPCLDLNTDKIFLSGSSNKLSFNRIVKLKKYIKKYKFDILHCHLPHSWFMGLLMKRLFFKNIKLVLHEHAEIHRKNFFIPVLVNMTSKKSDRYIACSKSVKNELLKKTKISAKKVSVMYNFVNEDIVSKTVKSNNLKLSDLNYPDNYFIVGFAGRLVERKGWRVFLDAAKFLEHKKYIRFIIAGDGPDKKKLLKKMNAEGISKNSIYISYVDNMKDFYERINVMVIPSFWEGNCIVQLETMQKGVPLICSNTFGLKEVAVNKENALMFRKGDAEDLAEKILYVYNYREEALEMAEKSKKNVEKYSYDIFMDKLNKIYDII